MTIGTAINKELLANAGVAAIAGERVYPVIVPEPEDGEMPPTVAHLMLSRKPEIDISGTSAWSTYRYEFSAMSEDYDTTQELAAAVIEALNNFSGLMGGSEGRMCRHSTLEDQRDAMFAEEAHAGIYVSLVEFDFKISE